MLWSMFLVAWAGWQAGPGAVSAAQRGDTAHIQGQGTCYLDLNEYITPSEIEGLSFWVRGEGEAGVRLVLDIQGSAYGVAQHISLDGGAREVILAKRDAVLLQMIPPIRDAPDRAFLFIDAAQKVDIKVWGLETW